MNSIYSVSDIGLNVVKDEEYDFAFLASGYEERCTAIAKQLNSDKFKTKHVFGFTAEREHSTRRDSDSYFAEFWSSPVLEETENDRSVVELLRELSFCNKESIRILVDYSSMSRLWYNAIINWIELHLESKVTIADFAYATGIYEKQSTEHYIKAVNSVPGCEGRPSCERRATTLFGLGFDGDATLCVYDMLEPDENYCFAAADYGNRKYLPTVKRKNEEIIAHHCDGFLILPLLSVERVYMALGEVVSQKMGVENITVIPMGPKPHVLASILLANRFSSITCLRVGMQHKPPRQVVPAGEFCVTRVIFLTESGLNKEALPAIIHSAEA